MARPQPALRLLLFSLVAFAGANRVIEDFALSAEDTSDNGVRSFSKDTSSAVPLEVVEWDLPTAATPPHMPKECFTSPTFEVTLKTGFSLKYCPISKESSEHSSLHFYGPTGISASFTLSCDGVLILDMMEFRFANNGYGSSKFAEAGKCSKVSVEVYKLVENRWTWKTGGIEEGFSEKFELAGINDWQMFFKPEGKTAGKCSLYLYGPKGKTVTVKYAFLLGEDRKALKRHGRISTHTFENGQNWGQSAFADAPCHKVGVEFLMTTVDSITHHFHDDSEISSDKIALINEAVSAGRRAEDALIAQAGSIKRKTDELASSIS